MVPDFRAAESAPDLCPRPLFSGSQLISVGGLELECVTRLERGAKSYESLTSLNQSVTKRDRRWVTLVVSDLGRKKWRRGVTAGAIG